MRIGKVNIRFTATCMNAQSALTQLKQTQGHGRHMFIPNVLSLIIPTEGQTRGPASSHVTSHTPNVTTTHQSQRHSRQGKLQTQALSAPECLQALCNPFLNPNTHLVDLPRGDVVVLSQCEVHESLIVSQVKVRLERCVDVSVSHFGATFAVTCGTHLPAIWRSEEKLSMSCLQCYAEKADTAVAADFDMKSEDKHTCEVLYVNMHLNLCKCDHMLDGERIDQCAKSTI